MLRFIGIENFRIFKEYTEFEFTPITVLTGPNNSGKSSVLKLLNLIKQGVLDVNNLNILNFESEMSNLGNYDNSLNFKSKNEDIILTLDFPFPILGDNFKLEIVYGKLKNLGFIKSYKVFNKDNVLFSIEDLKISLNNNSTNSGLFEVEFQFSYDLCLLKKMIFFDLIKDDESYYKESIIKEHSSYTKNYYFNDEKFINLRDFVKLKYPEYFDEIINKYNEYLFFTYRYLGADNDYYLNGHLNKDLLIIESNIKKIKTLIKTKIDSIKNKDILIDLLFYNNEHLVYPKFIKEWKEDAQLVDFLSSTQINTLSDILVEDFDSIIIEDNYEGEVFDKLKQFYEVFLKIKSDIERIEFISAQRGVFDRILTKYSQGEIKKMVKYFGELDLDIKGDFIKKAFKILGIEGELLIERFEDAGIVYLKNKDGKINIADIGYGLTQVIPILLKILIIKQRSYNEFETNFESEFQNDLKTDITNKNSILIIEEPEANLHPNLQSKLADVLVLAYKTFGIHFILETHSEYLARKLQYLTAKKEINPGDVNIYYFNADEYVSKEEPKVKKIQIDKFGSLTDHFGPGFYDEATTLKFDLMKLNREQQN